MELVSMEPAIDAVKLFEYNSFPIEAVQNIWFSAWVEHAKTEFENNVIKYGKSSTTLKTLAQLFKESYEVGYNSIIYNCLLIP